MQVAMSIDRDTVPPCWSGLGNSRSRRSKLLLTCVMGAQILVQHKSESLRRVLEEQGTMSVVASCKAQAEPATPEQGTGSHRKKHLTCRKRYRSVLIVVSQHQSEPGCVWDGGLQGVPEQFC
jgi:hypothetical protein